MYISNSKHSIFAMEKRIITGFLTKTEGVILAQIGLCHQRIFIDEVRCADYSEAVTAFICLKLVSNNNLINTEEYDLMT